MSLLSVYCDDTTVVRILFGAGLHWLHGFESIESTVCIISNEDFPFEGRAENVKGSTERERKPQGKRNTDDNKMRRKYAILLKTKSEKNI